MSKQDYKIDVDIAIKKYNKENPDQEKMTRQKLGKIIGVHPQIFSDWKHKKNRTPSIINRLMLISEALGTEIKELIIK
jgi:hypothetical protein